MFSTLHPLDLAVLAAYFLVVTFLGVVVGKRQTRNLRDFFTAGGKWGSLVAFIYVFASAVGGAEAVVVGGAAYRSGLSGVWLWFAGGLGLIIYYIFAPIYKRVRVFNLAEVFEMRFGPQGWLPALPSWEAFSVCFSSAPSLWPWPRPLPGCRDGRWKSPCWSPAWWWPSMWDRAA